MLANILRTDRHIHRPLPVDTELARAIKVTARAHQEAIWARQQTTNRLRSLLRDYYPQALVAFPNLTHRAAASVLRAAPTPEAAAHLTPRRVVTLLRTAGRRNDPGLAERSAVRCGLPRDDPQRFADARAVRSFAGTAPITRASGRSRMVSARRICNRRLGDACHWWAFAALTQIRRRPSPLRPTSGPGRHPQRRAAQPRQQTTRQTLALPANQHGLRRSPCLASTRHDKTKLSLLDH